MKTELRVMALILSCFASGAAISAGTNPGDIGGAQGPGGQINFTGNITDASCNVDTAKTDENVRLGTWASSYFTTVGTETQKQPFHISVKDCPDTVTKVAVLFDGQAADANEELLAINNGPGTATGVAVQLYEDDKQQKVKLGHVTNEHDIKTHDKDTELTFYADYRSTSEDVTVGEANAVVNFSMVYN
ncbi:fimbrial protein [Mixta calida]|uniref:fimbrial protein n=1 Tax=Mixta calida TaxID=665913 RepID=UPI001680CDE3|nr:fimbrial protein [Mixta sp.]MCR1566119.1 type 1 fimbrial protein [Mixta sp.]MDU3077436.1 fimbrial protein [Mixta calida]QNU43656.1 type 1 fimbrial protein [Mixta calida]